MASESLSSMSLTGPTYPELTCSSSILYPVGGGVTVSHLQISLPPISFVVQTQRAMHEISVTPVRSSLERLSSELHMRIKPEAEDLIERMARSGELNLGTFLRGTSRLIRRAREMLPEKTHSVSIEAFEDPEVEGWRAPVIRFELDTTDFDELDATWNRLIEMASEAFGEGDSKRIYISVRPRLR